MTQRVNITISDELHQRLQPFKDKVNVSAICQTALESVVQMEEAMSQAVSQKDAVVSKLKAQAKNATDKWFQEGKKQGLEAASNTDYEYFIALSDLHDKGVRATEIANYKSGDGYYIFGWMDDLLDEEGCPQKHRESYLDGVVEGLLGFWNDIKDEVLDD